MPICGHVISRENDLVSIFPADSVECFLPLGHKSEHLAKICEGVYVVWNYECYCDEVECECLNYRKINQVEALEITKVEGVAR